MKRLTTAALSTAFALALANFAPAQDWSGESFRLTSREFKDGDTLPISAISNYTVNGSNACSINGAPGGNESPELMWSQAPRATRSFALTVFDVTAGVVHWGMYNISAEITSLPKNAGIADSSYGQQVLNVFSDQSYDGPCPPADYPPNNHHYVFTIYALDTELDLYSPANFPASALTLYRALLEAGRSNHILASATLTGLYSTTPP